MVHRDMCRNILVCTVSKKALSYLQVGHQSKFAGSSVIPSLQNETIQAMIDWATPWEPSPTLLTLFIIGIFLFVSGCRVHHVITRRRCVFFIGVVIQYVWLYTQVGYYTARVLLTADA